MNSAFIIMVVLAAALFNFCSDSYMLPNVIVKAKAFIFLKTVGSFIVSYINDRSLTYISLGMQPQQLVVPAQILNGLLMSIELHLLAACQWRKRLTCLELWRSQLLLSTSMI